MPNAARLTDAVDGTTAGEHSGHVPPHSPEPFTGEISGACSGDVRVNGLAAATVGSITTERDGCCGSSRGAVAAGSGTVRINGKAAARTGDALAPHSGSGTITGGSATVRIGGQTMAIGTLGRKIVFEVSDDRVFTFSEMTREITSRWANHEPQGVKPKPEFLGAGLQTASLTITISATLGVRPRDVLEAIENMVENGTAETLVIGNRPVGNNPFRLTGSSETWGVVYNRGELARASMTINLEEYT